MGVLGQHHTETEKIAAFLDQLISVSSCILLIQIEG